MIYIYIDDLRTCPKHIQENFSTITVRDAKTAIETISHLAGQELLIDFDHDLGEGPSGYDVAKYIVENQIPISGYTIHSQNSVGAWNIHQLMSHYGYWRFEV